MSADRPLPQESAEELYEHAPCGYLSTLPDGTIVKVNATFLRWTGHSREALVGHRRFEQLLTVGGRIYHETHMAPLLLMQGAVREIALEIVRADGARLPVLVNSTVRSDADGTPLLIRTTVFDATSRRAYERELLRARDRERIERERTERLQRLTAALATTLSAEAIGAAIVTELASLGADRVAFVVGDGETADGIDVVTRHPLVQPGDGRLPSERLVRMTADALRTGQTRFVEQGEASAALPLAIGGEPIGVLWLGYLEPHGFSEADRAFLLACAGQCAQALDRARLYERQRDVADTLQRALLADPPPSDPRFEVAAHYQPAAGGLEVGGDWHDTFATGEDRIAVVVGDVVGRGLLAASAMGQLRSAVRALGTAELAPGDLLDRLDAFVRPIEAARGATLLYAVLELDSRRVRYAAAGHPPPLLVEPGAPPRLLWEGRSPPLGVAGTREQAEVTLAPGAWLLLYTDGLVERRGAVIDVGLQRLLDAVQRRRDLAPADLARELPDAMRLADDRHDDDVCLLLLAVR